MNMLTTAEIANFRSELANYPLAMEALDIIEDCEGDLEDAAMVLAIRSGQRPDIANSEWLDSLAKKCRAAICQPEFRNDLVNGNLAAIVEYLAPTKLCPDLLIAPVLIYVFQQGANKFCEPLDPVL